MKNYESKAEKDEINFQEIFSIIWYYRKIISLFIFIFLIFSVYYYVQSRKIYTSTSVFVPTKSSTKSVFSDLSSLSQLLGSTSSQVSSSAEMIERMSSREFILVVADDLQLREDKFFNSYDPNIPPPAWKQYIKTLIGLDNIPRDHRAIATWNVLNNYSKHISFESGQRKIKSQPSTDSITINVDHTDPIRAAKIANHIVQKIIALSVKEDEEKKIKQLNYLSNTLAEALQDLEEAQKSLKDFSLRNSAQTTTSFAAGSILLDNLRYKRDQSVQQIKTIKALKLLLKKPKSSEEEYRHFQKNYPLVNEPSFRRMLGMSEIVSSPTWPNLGRVTALEHSIQDRLSSLEAEITKTEIDVNKYAKSSEELYKLNRKLRNAEALYTVLMEQVKAQSLMAGMNFDKARILAFADVPINPSGLGRVAIMSVGCLGGLLAGVFCSLILGYRKNTYFSSELLLNAIDADFTHKIHMSKKVRRMAPDKIMNLSHFREMEWSKQLVLDAANHRENSLVLILDTTPANCAGVISQILASDSEKLGRNIAIFDLSNKIKSEPLTISKYVNHDLGAIEISENCNEYIYLHSKKNIEWIFSNHFQDSLEFLLNNHNIVIMSANEDALKMLESSPILTQSYIVTFVENGKTKASVIERLSRRARIKTALHA